MEWMKSEDILLNMFFGADETQDDSDKIFKTRKGNVRESIVGSDIKEDKPRNAIFVCDQDRLYATSRELMLPDVSKLTGSVEILLDKDDGLYWGKAKRINRPKGYHSIGRDWFELHWRKFFGEYVKGYVCLKGDKEMPVYRTGWGKQDWTPNSEPGQVQIHFSFLDDYLSIHGVRVELEFEGKVLKLVCTHSQAYDLLSVRDGPIANRKKRPVLHWVVYHKNNKEKTKYLRGKEEFVIDGINVKVKPMTGVNG